MRLSALRLGILGALALLLPQASAQSSAVEGAWEPSFALPLIAIHSAVLPTGKVLLFSAEHGVTGRLLDSATLATGYPNTNLANSFSYLLSGSGMNARNRTTIDIGFDAMQNLALPNKVRRAGEVAFDKPRAAGHRFAQAKFRLQLQVLEGFLDLSLTEEELRIARELLVLAQLSANTAAGRVQAGGGGREPLRAQVEGARIEDEVANLDTRARTQRAGMLAAGCMA